MKQEERPPIVMPDPLFTIKGKDEPVQDDVVIPWEDLKIEFPEDEQEPEKTSERVSLAELYQRPELLVPPPALFDGIAYKGRHTLFAGREKLGKSEILGLLSARAEGEAPILYFSFEEATGDLVARTKRYGVDPSRVSVVEQVTGVDDIRRHIEELVPELVVIDSLSSLLKRQLGVTASENSDEWGTWVEHITHVSHEADVGVVTSHHGNRERGDYRGHSSIAAAVDLLVEMFGKSSEHTRSFTVIGRVRGVRVPKLQWTGSVYALESDTEDAFIRADVRNLLHSEPGRSMNDLKKAINRRGKDVSRVVNQMLSEREILDLNHNPANRALVNADDGARFPETDVKS